MKFNLLKAVFTGLILTASGFASAGLITNGDFETGDFSSWTNESVVFNGNPACTTDWYVSQSDTQCQHNSTQLGAANEGVFSAWNSFDGGANTNYVLSQAVNLGGFSSVELSFDFTLGWNFNLGGVATLDRVFSISFRDALNQTIGDAFALSIGPNDGATGLIGWTTSTIDVTQLLESFENQVVTLVVSIFVPEHATGPGSFGIDAININKIDSATAVPEPASIAILALGLLGMVSRRFKKA